MQTTFRGYLNRHFPDKASARGAMSTSRGGPSKLDHVRRRGLSGSDPLDVVAPQVERVALLGVVAVAIRVPSSTTVPTPIE